MKLNRRQFFVQKECAPALSVRESVVIFIDAQHILQMSAFQIEISLPLPIGDTFISYLIQLTVFKMQMSLF